jgi:hemolysin III
MEIDRDRKHNELANAITHGVGACLAIAALAILVVFASLQGNVWHVVSFSVFGSTLVLLYFASTLYHSIPFERTKPLFRKFDHMAIYLLIAGTYTPYCLVTLRGNLGWILFGVIWGSAVLGITLKAFFTGKKELLSTIFYVIMGWAAVFAFNPLHELLSPSGFWLLIVGGLCYTAGTFFFIRDKVKYNHSIWHLFVLAGSIFHFFSVMTLLR